MKSIFYGLFNIPAKGFSTHINQACSWLAEQAFMAIDDFFLKRLQRDRYRTDIPIPEFSLKPRWRLRDAKPVISMKPPSRAASFRTLSSRLRAPVPILPIVLRRIAF